MARERGTVLVGIKHTVRGEWGAAVVSGREWFVCVCVWEGVCVCVCVCVRVCVGVCE